MRANIKIWATIAVASTFILGTMYVVAHQVLRQSANDPQIQMAEDWAASIVQGDEPGSLHLGNFIDPSKSYQPFGIIYDQDGLIVNSSVAAPTNMLQPDGVFTTVDNAPNNEARYTWQPATGDRYAAVLKRANLQDGTSYYVLAGRNLKLVEERESRVMWLTFIGLVITLVATFVAINVHLIGHVVRKIKAKRSKK